MYPLVSITMSAYNVEHFLRDCLDCVVNQTLREIEIICVNDGSTDRTLAILQEYASCEPRLIIIDKQVNEGLAVARNDALAIAKGKYIGFVDSDDLIDRDLFRKAFVCAEKKQSDLLFWDYVTFIDNKELGRKLSEPSSLVSMSPTDKIGLLNRPAFSCTKLIRTDVVRSLGISFPEGLSRQDIPVHWQLITQLDKIAILPERLYYYRQQSSATTHRTDWKLADLAIVMDLVKNYLEENELYATYRDIFLEKQLGLLCGFQDKIDQSLKPKATQWIIERLGNDQWQYILEKKKLRWQTRDFYMALHGSLFAKSRRALWLFARRCYRALK